MQGRSTIIGMTNGSAEKALTDLQHETVGSVEQILERDREAAALLTPEQRQTLATDYSLDGSLLDDKYNPNGDGEHPVYGRAEWRTAVTAEDTIIGYWDWVEYRIELYHALV